MIAGLLAGGGAGSWIAHQRSRQLRSVPPDEHQAMAAALADLLDGAVPADASENAGQGRPPAIPDPVVDHTGGDHDAASLLDLALGQQGLNRDSVRVAVLEERLRHIEKELTVLRNEQVGEGKVVAVVLYVLAAIAAVFAAAVGLR